MKVEISAAPYSCTILADTIHPKRLGRRRLRLTTLAVVMPRPFLAELVTHRTFSRNSASSRAIPTARLLASAKRRPYLPEAFGQLRPGMRGGEPLPPDRQEAARRVWEAAAEAAHGYAQELVSLGAHKEHVNRLIEPFIFTTVIISATDWSNFFHRRLDPNAQPEMQAVARSIQDAINASTPVIGVEGRWDHLPLVTAEERDDPSLWPVLHRLSTARCARVSYLTHDGIRDPAEDLALHDRLLESGHMSPFEHAARVGNPRRWYGNFRGFQQYRKTIRGEADLPPAWARTT